MARSLPVWLYGVHLADVTGTRTGAVSCRYTSEALARWDLNIPLLSCSLPLRRGPHRHAAPFFRGLLPEGDALRAMASAAGVTVTDTYGMVARFGRDVAGALVLGDPWDERAGDVEPYDDAGLTRDVLDLQDSPLGLHDDSELSLAGLQDKLLLVQTPAGLGQTAARLPLDAHPQGGGPTVPRPRRARGRGAPARRCRRPHPGDAPADRRRRTDVHRRGPLRPGAGAPGDGRLTVALPQGPPGGRLPGIGRRRRRGAGPRQVRERRGPGFRDVATLLDQHAGDAPRQLERLLATVVFTVAIGNADAHGKNLALVHTSTGVVELAPLYDTVPTALFPSLRDELAMSVGGRRRLGDVTGADVLAEAGTWPSAVPGARAVVERTASALRDATQRIELTDELADHVRRRTAQLLDTL